MVLEGEYGKQEGLGWGLRVFPSLTLRERRSCPWLKGPALHGLQPLLGAPRGPVTQTHFQQEFCGVCGERGHGLGKRRSFWGVEGVSRATSTNKYSPDSQMKVATRTRKPDSSLTQVACSDSVCGTCLFKMPADSFCLVDNSVIEIEREGKAGRVAKKPSMKGKTERSWEEREGRVESREPGHWGEVVRACLKQYTLGFSQSSHTQCARSMSLSQRSPATGPAVAVRRQSTTPSKSKADKAQTQNNSVFVDLLEIISCIQMTVSCRYKPDVGIPRLSSISVQSGSSKPSSGAVAGKGGGTRALNSGSHIWSFSFEEQLIVKSASPRGHIIRPYKVFRSPDLMCGHSDVVNYTFIHLMHMEETPVKASFLIKPAVAEVMSDYFTGALYQLKQRHLGMWPQLRQLHSPIPLSVTKPSVFCFHLRPPTQRMRNRLEGRRLGFTLGRAYSRPPPSPPLPSPPLPTECGSSTDHNVRPYHPNAETELNTFNFIVKFPIGAAEV
ncbi:hypothetical protein Q8A73_006021 [Channa argus]|nr:hypothetical protein Q8A73_006021 [Channa argus]